MKVSYAAGFAEGEVAAQERKARSNNPYSYTTEPDAYEGWDKGFKAEQRSMNASMIDDMGGAKLIFAQYA